MGRLLSLCIPTNGVTEWVVQVVDSIYRQGVDDALFEVVITDNGQGDECERAVRGRFGMHDNLRYQRTDAYMFLNQIEAFRLARGAFIKFVNHRAVMTDGSVEYLLGFVREHINDAERPIACFPGSMMQGEPCRRTYATFDGFVRGLSYVSSYSGGLACWKDDFDSLPKDLAYNELYPHTTILFYFRDRGCYVIDNEPIFRELPADHKKKGSYKLYYAFGVEYPSILLDLVRSSDITTGTFLEVKKANEAFLADCYAKFEILGEPHSYDLSGAEDYLDVYYSVKKIIAEARRMACSKRAKAFVKKLIGRGDGGRS